MNFAKIVKADLDSPRRMLPNGGLGIVITLLFVRIFLCASTGDPIEL